MTPRQTHPGSTATPAELPELTVPAIVRGETVGTDLVEFGVRGGGAGFHTPDPARLAARLPLADPASLRELQDLDLQEIVAFLDELGRHLTLEDNPYLQEALAYSELWSDMTPPLVEASFAELPAWFAADAVFELADATIGADYLDGWVTRPMADGRVAHIKAVGARAIHIIAGNSPLIAALSIIRNAITRSDAIIKTPSNDPLTALAIARTMADLAPDHPLTRHLSVAYWKGGDTDVERVLYTPRAAEKIIAWGGLASVTHVTGYLQPGLELITLDPKRSATVIGAEAFDSETTENEVALRLATDIGAMNQLGCVNARVVYVASGIDDDGLARLNRLGERTYERLQHLPSSVSTPTRTDPELAGSVDALRASPDWYRVHGGTDGHGAVIVSQLDEPVDFHRALAGRIANLVPIERPTDAIRDMTADTQTVGVYPESLKTELRDVLPLHGVQRLVSLGYAAAPNAALPQDAIEPVRRMVKWIVDEHCDPDRITPLWAQDEPNRQGGRP